MATTIYDVTLLQGLIGLFNAIVGVSYLILGWYIMRNKSYLKWKPHIYPVTMWGCFTFGISLMWYAGTNYYADLEFHGIIMHFFQFAGASAISYAVWQDVERLVYKYDKMQEQETEIVGLKNEVSRLNTIIRNLKINRPLKIIFWIVSLLILNGCGGLKKEINRLITEQSSSSKEYENSKKELTATIQEKENSLKTKDEKITEQQRQIEKFFSEKTALQEKFNQQNKDDVNIKNALGKVKITDVQGNTYEVDSQAGTEISKKSESTIAKEVQEWKEKAMSFRDNAINVTKQLFSKDAIIKDKETKIAEKDAVIKNIEKKNKDLALKVQKNITRKATPIWVWMLTGFLLCALLVFLWNVYKPRLLIYLKKLKTKE